MMRREREIVLNEREREERNGRRASYTSSTSVSLIRLHVRAMLFAIFRYGSRNRPRFRSSSRAMKQTQVVPTDAFDEYRIETCVCLHTRASYLVRESARAKFLFLSAAEVNLSAKDHLLLFSSPVARRAVFIISFPPSLAVPERASERECLDSPLLSSSSFPALSGKRNVIYLRLLFSSI